MNQKASHTQPESYKARTAYQNKTVATLYEQKRFSSWRGRLGNWLDRRIFKLASSHLPQNGGIVLDVPCGTGRAVSWITQAGYQVIGADISAEMIAVARHHSTSFSVSPSSYVQANAARLPFRSKVFACATAIRFMGHVPSTTRIQILRELARVSRGYIIADYCISHPVTNMRRRIDSLFRNRSLGFDRNWTWQSIPRHQLESEFRAADLQAVQWFAKLRFLSDAWMVLLAHEDGELGQSTAENIL